MQDETPATNAIDPRAVYRAPDVAKLVFHHPVDWFYRNRARLEREEGFPGPISRIGQPRWSGERLLQWIVTPRSPHAQAGPSPDLTGNILQLRIQNILREHRERKNAKLR